jgi:hypothetical protein
MPANSSQTVQSVTQGQHAATLTPQERQQWLDHEWVLGDLNVQSTYGGSVVAVANRTILAVGPTHLAALQTALARADCPPREQIVTVAVEGRPLPAAEVLKRKEQP